MKIEEAAVLLDGMLNYWPNILRGNDPEAMAKAWAVALDDIPLRAAKMAAANLARTLKFPPTVYELAQAATQYLNPQQKWDELLNYQAKTKFVDTITRAKARCEAYAEERLFDRNRTTGAQFSLKCNFGWNDKSPADTDGEVRIVDDL